MAIYAAQDGSWQATQADAKAHGGIVATFEVPTTKAGWLELLNLKREPHASEPSKEVAADVQGSLNAPPELPPLKHAAPSRTADGVMQWVLDEASTADIENLFAALGARFHEATRRAR